MKIRPVWNEDVPRKDDDIFVINFEKICKSMGMAVLVIFFVVSVFTMTPRTIAAHEFTRDTKASSWPTIESKNHYAIVVDAGSSGSRAYLYHWPEENTSDLLKITPLTDVKNEPLVKSVSPGLSSFDENPTKAFEYIKPLLQFAADWIPNEHHSETPLYILATAGMRLIDYEKQQAILSNVRVGIATHFDFSFPDSHLEIITGKQEGIYQWIAINYVLDKFDAQSDNNIVNMPGDTNDLDDNNSVYIRPKTVGALDMGGASMQIAMEVTSDLSLQGFTEKDKEQVVEINLGCRDDSVQRYRLFVKTFLGFGANEAIARYHRNSVLSQKENEMLGLTSSNPISDPCLPNGLTTNLTVNLDLNRVIDEAIKTKLTEEQLIFLYGTGEWEKCYRILTEFTIGREPYFESCSSKDQGCPNPGMQMPPLPMENSEFYGFSEFWYSMEEVLGMGGPYLYDKFSEASKSYCSNDWKDTYQNFLNGVYQNADLKGLKNQCIKSAWVTVALHQGLKFPKNSAHLSSSPNTVNGQVVHWTVGALLYRTRFYPLRYMNGGNHITTELGLDSPHSHYILLFILATAVVGTFIYLKRFKRCWKPSAIRRVESFRFLLTTPSDLSTPTPSSQSSNDIEKGFLPQHSFASSCDT